MGHDFKPQIIQISSYQFSFFRNVQKYDSNINSSKVNKKRALADISNDKNQGSMHVETSTHICNCQTSYKIGFLIILDACVHINSIWLHYHRDLNHSSQTILQFTIIYRGYILCILYFIGCYLPVIKVPTTFFLLELLLRLDNIFDLAYLFCEIYKTTYLLGQFGTI